MEENEWEAIQPPSSATTSTTQSDEDDGDAVVVKTPNSNEPPIFPPTNHEDLPVIPPPQQNHRLQEPSSPPSSYSSSPPSSYSSSPTPPLEIVESALPREPESGSSRSNASWGVLSSGVLRIAYGICRRIGVWSFVSVAALVVMAVYGERWRRWRRRVEKESRDQLVLLVNQKDEKIKQLLLQIDRMNEMLTARRKVPVFRVERPLVTGPRANWRPT